MEKHLNIFESRMRLDNALSLPDLANEDSIASLIKEQLIQSTLTNNQGDVGKIVESRTKEVANFLEMLRSASGSGNSNLNFSKDWKVKQDTTQLRVMYCEGSHGSPFHTLLLEGFADGPMDVCLCVSWELTLYKKWWPQYTIPTFKIISSSCLEKVRIGEEISLIRVKVPWPVSDREAVVHYFEIEYFKEDLILVLIKTLSDTEQIDAEALGFNTDGIPQAKDTIRIDLVGGFVLQKVKTDRCYFRAIFNFDIKLDFVPPSLINFISRQLVGNGHKLYQKAIGSVASTDADYRDALQGPLYARIRHHLHLHNKSVTSLEDFDKEKFEEYKKNAMKTSSIPEITVEDTEQSPEIEGINTTKDNVSENMVADEYWDSSKEKAFISPEVEHALGILDQAITIVRSKNCSAKHSPSKSGDVSEFINKLKLINNPETSPHEDDHRNNNMSRMILEAAPNDVAKHSLHKEIVSESKFIHSSKSYRGMQPPALDSHFISKVCDEETLKANEFHNCQQRHFLSGRRKKTKRRLCLPCLNPKLFQD